MTFELVSRTILETKDEAALPYTVPFGRVGCALLPDGTFVVSAYYDSTPNDRIRVWKLDTDGTVLGDVWVETNADNDGRMHLIALDGFLVQALYMTGAQPGGKSLIFDCSGDTPVMTGMWEDTLGTNGYGSDSGLVNSIYLRVPGVVIVFHGSGVSMYRRGRPVISREGPYGTGWGMFAHPTDPYKCAFWSYSSTSPTVEGEGFEVTVTGDSTMTVEPIPGTSILSADTYWILGAGSPYSETQLLLQEDDSQTNGPNSWLVVTGTGAYDEPGGYLDPLWAQSFPRTPLPLTGEAFWSTAAWGTPLADTANEYFVGAAPRLTSADDATSYAYIGTANPGASRLVAELPAATLAPGDALRLSMRVRIVGSYGSTLYTKYNVGTSADSTPIASIRITNPSVERDQWVDEETYFHYSAPLAAALASGDAVVWVTQSDSAGNFTYGNELNVSAIVAEVGPPPQWVNSDAIGGGIGDSTERWMFCHEVNYDVGADYLNPARPAFGIQAGIVDNSTGTPTVEIVQLEYGITTPFGYWEDYYAVSLLTGSHAMSHRNGEIVIATCIVQQDGSPNDYFCVVAWKLTGGDVARLSGLDGDWRLGINNATGLTGLQTSDGMLVEASHEVGVDAAARPAMIKTSDGWKMLGRYAEPPTCLAPTGEAIWQNYEPTPDDPAPYWVGTAPRLTTLDDASYAHVGISDSNYPVVLFPPTPCPEGSYVKITARVRLLGTWTGYGEDGWSAETMLVFNGSGFASNIIRTPVVADGEWHTYTSFVPWLDEIEDWATEIETDGFAVGIFGNTGSTEQYDVSYIEACVVPGVLEPELPPTVDVTFVPTALNADLAAAQTLAGASLVWGGKTWGAFAAQAGGPPEEGLLYDGSDTTFTTFAQADGAGGPVEVLTARMAPRTILNLPGTPVAVLTPAENGGSVHTIEPAPDSTALTWVGTAPWLTFATTSKYAEGDTTAAKVGWLIDAIPDLVGPLTVNVAAHYSPASATSVQLYLHDVDILTAPGADLVDDALATGSAFNGAGTWHGVVPTTLQMTPGIAAAAAAGRLVVVAGIGLDMRLSMLQVRASTDAVIPPTGIPVGAALNVVGKAGASSSLGNYIDGQVTTNGNAEAVRGKYGSYDLRLSFDLGPAMSYGAHGANQISASLPHLPPSLNPSWYTRWTSIDTALGVSAEVGASWWHDYLADPDNYVVFQAAAKQATHGNFDLAEFSITIRYLIP